MDDKSIAYSQALIALLKGVVEKDAQLKQWETIQSQRTQVEDYFSKIGLVLNVVENDSCCFLKQQDNIDAELEIPRLIPRHQLSYPVSLLLVLLRKQMLDFDSSSNDSRLIIGKQDIIEKMQVFLKNTSNEAKQIKDIEGYIKRVEDMGFIKKLKDSKEQYEILRIIRSFIDGEWLHKIEQRLDEYKDYSINDENQGGDSDESI